MRLEPSLVIMVLAAFVGGCGNGAPSKKAFITEADAICKPATDAALALTTPGDFVSLRQFHLTLADRADETVGAVEKLRFPGGADGEAARGWVKSVRDASGTARQVVKDVDLANYAAVEAGATNVIGSFQAADSQARAFGFAECGRGDADVVGRMAKALPKAVKEAFVQAVNEVCRSAAVEIERLQTPKTLPEFKTRLDEATVIEEKAVTGIKAIAAPSTDKALLDELVAAMEAVMSHYKEMAGAVAANRPIASLSDKSEEIRNKASAAARGFGAYQCSRLV